MGSVVASRSVALPLPSSPHWAPSTTIAGISALLVVSRLEKKQPRHKAPGLLRRHATAPGRPAASPGWNGRGTPWATVRTCARCSSSPTPMPARPTRRASPRPSRSCASEASVEVAKTSNPGELDGVLHRAGGRTVVVAGGDGSLHAVVTALHKRHELAGSTLGLLPMGTGNDFARGNDIPLEVEDAARLVLDGEPRTVDLIIDEVGSVVVNNVHVGVGAQASRKGHGGRAGSAPSASARSTSASSATRSAPCSRPSTRRAGGCGSRSTARWSTTSTARPDGRDRQRRQRRRRHRAEPRRRHRGRPARRDDLPGREADGEARLRRQAAHAATTTSATTC